MLAITVFVLSNSYKVNGAVARKVLRDFASKGLIKQVGDHNAHFTLYTGSQAKIVDKTEEVAKGGAKKGADKGAADKKGAAEKKGAEKKAPAAGGEE